MRGLPCSLIQFPSGRWGYVGKVPAALSFVRKDGSEASAAELMTACEFGPDLAGVKTRSWATEADAIAARKIYSGEA